MSNLTKYLNQKDIYSDEEEEIVNNIVNKIDDMLLFDSWDKKNCVKHIILDEFNDLLIYKCKPEGSTTQLKWRLAYLLLVCFQWMLWPYCLFRWLKTGSSSIPRNTMLANLINKITNNIS